MANELKKEIVTNPDVLAQLVSVLQNLQGGIGQQPNNSLTDKLDRVLGKQILENEEQERVLKEAQRQGAEAMDKKNKMERAKEDFCPHIKPNNQSAVGGQRDHSNNYLYICQYCGKNWTQKDLPPMLAPPNIFIGGPQIN